MIVLGFFISGGGGETYRKKNWSPVSIAALHIHFRGAEESCWRKGVSGKWREECAYVEIYLSKVGRPAVNRETAVIKMRFFLEMPCVCQQISNDRGLWGDSNKRGK